jgi:hypothetical protein
MRAPLTSGALPRIARTAWLAPLFLFACAASTSETAAPPATDLGTSIPAPAPGGETQADAGAGARDSAPPPPKNDCKLAALTGVADVTPDFVMHQPPASAPPAMAGGTLQGDYRVDKATVYLPSGAAGLVDPNKSTGSINAWAILDGTNYRLHLKAAFLISSVLGPQNQGADTASQGGFKTSGATLTLDHACNTALSDEADYSFTDNGSGRATLLIKTPSPYGDTYLELGAKKN